MTYAVLGTTDEVTACELCGRDDLKSTVALRNEDTGEVVHFGSDCAARASGWTGREVRTRVRDADRQRREAEARERRAAQDAQFKTWEEFLLAETGEPTAPLAISALGGFAAAREAFRASA